MWDFEAAGYAWTEIVEQAGGRPIRLRALTSFEDNAARVHRATQGRGGARLQQDLSPMFGVIWGAARALVDRLDALGTELRGQQILELGCGLALPSMVAARYGARVLATEQHPHTEELLRYNLDQNGISGVRYQALDWRTPPALPERSFDRVLASDVLFARELPELVIAQFARYLAPDGIGWLADPGRAWLDEVTAAAERHDLSLDIDIAEVRRPDLHQEVYFLTLRHPATAPQ